MRGVNRQSHLSEILRHYILEVCSGYGARVLVALSDPASSFEKACSDRLQHDGTMAVTLGKNGIGTDPQKRDISKRKMN